jgi:RNA polymerase sigma factor (sigma-70 family)
MASAAPEIPALARDRAFEQLYRRHVKDVYHYALALLRNPADAEDVTQTTFLNAYRAYKRGEQIEKPQNWLIKIAHNAARNRYARAARRVREVPLEDHVEQLAVPEAERPNVREVLDALGRLPLNQRAALVMRELEGRTYAEIADTLGVSVAAVETLIFRARRSLRVKASAIRVLGIVPVPGSLAQLLETGGVAAGGGAIVGSGFLFKAAVAIIAGVVATGMNSDRPRQADAASSPPGAQAAARGAGATRLRSGDPVKWEGSGNGSGRSLRPYDGLAGTPATGTVTANAGTGGAAASGGAAVASSAPSATALPAALPGTTSTGASTNPVTTATQAVSTTAATAQNALPVPAPLPAPPPLPVSVPVPPPPVQLPPPPVSLPPPPPLPLP